ncbi:unnamed protein product [Prorocentrum cordatum]|uniref:G-protein coupled receptors family 1 profile domain-containing protein n=1 Tax=Prorocentrum cordatum TaxID=2364126 RepID=A0ABN9TWA0_9DINO|nr:unnamed protein product [Polarella glacialis]
MAVEWQTQALRPLSCFCVLLDVLTLLCFPSFVHACNALLIRDVTCFGAHSQAKQFALRAHHLAENIQPAAVATLLFDIFLFFALFGSTAARHRAPRLLLVAGVVSVRKPIMKLACNSLAPSAVCLALFLPVPLASDVLKRSIMGTINLSASFRGQRGLPLRSSRIPVIPAVSCRSRVRVLCGEPQA